MDDKTEDVVDEVFLHCRKDREDDFLERDATFIRIEVDQNVMQKFNLFGIVFLLFFSMGSASGFPYAMSPE